MIRPFAIDRIEAVFLAISFVAIGFMIAVAL